MKKLWNKFFDGCDWLLALFKFSLFVLILWVCVKSLGTSATLVSLALEKNVPLWLGVYAGGFIVFFLIFIRKEFVFAVAFVVTLMNLWLLHYYTPSKDWLSALLPCPGIVCLP